jgi:hypothetical protein
MGYVQHDTVIVTTDESQAPDLDAFRASIPERFRRLVIGPIPSVVNAYVTCVFLPDGSKEGWVDSDTGDDIRARFVALFGQRFSDGSSWHDVVHVTYGGDYQDDSGITARDPRGRCAP